jgi:hypothetical protein
MANNRDGKNTVIASEWKTTTIHQCAPPVNNMTELVALGKLVLAGNIYKNIDNEMLKRILPHLEEIQKLIGLCELKQSLCKQMLYFLSHLHLPKEKSFLYNPTVNDKDENNAEKRPAEIIGRANKRKRLAQQRREQIEKEANLMMASIQLLMESHQTQPAIQTTTMSEGDYLNMVIYGNQGVGKSMVGAIIGKLFHSMEIFQTKKPTYPFRVVHADDLIGKYLGETAPKTIAVLNDSKGGVLMIEEAYSLASRTSNHNTYGEEAINAITAFLSENKNDICLILAGYENDIKQKIFALNKGLERRFPWVHVIKPYTPKELAEILLLKIKEAHWEIGFETSYLFYAIEDKKNIFKNSAGDMERLFNDIKIIHSQRMFSKPIADRRIITLKDAQAGIQVIENRVLAGEKTDRPPPEHMYI